MPRLTASAVVTLSGVAGVIASALVPDALVMGASNVNLGG